MRAFGFVSMVLIVWMAFEGLPQAAEMVVIASDDPSIKRGVILDGTLQIDVASDASVVVVSSDGRTFRILGPFHGALEVSRPSADSQLIKSLSQLIGVTTISTEKLATYRGKAWRRSKDGPDVWDIDITHSGTYCMRPDRPVMLWRPGVRSRVDVMLSRSGDKSRSVKVTWPRGERLSRWPREMNLSDGATYTVHFWTQDRGNGMHLVAILIPDLDTDAQRAAWMAEHGCTDQALKLLAALANETISRQNGVGLSAPVTEVR